MLAELQGKDLDCAGKGDKRPRTTWSRLTTDINQTFKYRVEGVQEMGEPGGFSMCLADATWVDMEHGEPWARV